MHQKPDIRFTDQYKYKGMRKRLVEEIQRKGAFDVRILKAMEKIPRHFFLESAFAEQAYEDKAFSIGENQTISQPYTVAYQTQLLEVHSNHKVLEIGTGSGYQACVLAELGAKVYSIERIQKLSDKAKEVINHLGYHNIKLFVGDGTIGLIKYAPYDRIIVTAAAPIASQALLNQLKVGGMMVIPIGDLENQQMVRIIRTSETDFQKETFDTFRFVPLIGERGW
jgi:protein-L-isoaspartate(D-aspartate) O-methyltransferase